MLEGRVAFGASFDAFPLSGGELVALTPLLAGLGSRPSVAYVRCRVSAVTKEPRARFGKSTRRNVMSCPTSPAWQAGTMHCTRCSDVAVAVSLGRSGGRSLRSARLQALIGDYSDATPHARRHRPRLVAPPPPRLQVCPRYPHGVSSACPSISGQPHPQPMTASAAREQKAHVGIIRPLHAVQISAPHADTHHIPAQVPSALEARAPRWREDWRRGPCG
jgi:hypothetical protein